MKDLAKKTALYVLGFCVVIALVWILTWQPTDFTVSGDTKNGYTTNNANGLSEEEKQNLIEIYESGEYYDKESPRQYSGLSW